MSIAESRTTYTPEDLLALPDGQACELIDGDLVEKKMSMLSSLVEGIILVKLSNHCSENDFGLAFPGSTGYQCFPWDAKRVRKPDVSVIRKSRITPELLKQGFGTIAPDVAVEVNSPNDLINEVNEKIEEFLRAGVLLVWVVDPELRNVTIYRKDGSASRLRTNDELTGEDVIPGFHCPISELFPPTKK